MLRNNWPQTNMLNPERYSDSQTVMDKNTYHSKFDFYQLECKTLSTFYILGVIRINGVNALENFAVFI